ncbi:1-phosphofructokinase family hexose kinase [Leucobacter aridicollis]|nr:1-phosphofructokinase family hexose kinase [Leucobacter aridicollis]
MIVTVTVNPALDVTYHLPALSPGESHRVDAPIARAGGKGVNVARVLDSQGFSTLALSTVGGLTGKQFAADLAGSGVPHELVRVASETRRSIAFVTDNGDATLFNERGTGLAAEEEAVFVAALRDGSAQASVVVVSGSLPPGTSSEFLGELIGACAQLPVIVDTSGSLLLDAARAGAHLLKPNAEELVQATGLTDPLAGARHLTELGARAVVVSLGEEGMMLALQGDPVVRRARLPEPLVGNPTGAGDAAVAAFASAIHRGELLTESDPSDALRRAVAWSAAAVLAPVAGEIDPAHTHLIHDVILTTEPMQ